MARYKFSGRTFRENGKMIVGPCTFDSPRDDLDKLFPDTMEKVDTASKQDIKPAEVDGGVEDGANEEAEASDEETEEEGEEESEEEEEEGGESEFSRGNKPSQNLTPVHRGGGKYNVEKPNGEAINDQLLSKEEAYEMCGKSEE